MAFAISILLFVTVFGETCVGIQPNLDSELNSRHTTRVMSFNIRYGTANDGENHWSKRKDFLIETINAFGPDLLGTQETLLDQRDFIASKLSGYESFGVGRDDGKQAGEMAALFYRTSRFEKVAGGHFWLSQSPDTGPRIDWIGCSRDFSLNAVAIDRTERDGRTPSDHFPVTAVLK